MIQNLIENIKKKDAPIVVGLDPMLSYIPDFILDEAFAAYDHCAEIDPNYEYGHIGKGIYLYNHAVDIQEKASNEMDDNKYMALVEEYDKTLKASVVAFEQAYEVTKDNEIKITVAEYIKNACFRFRTDPEYQAKYEKYEAVVASGK